MKPLSRPRPQDLSASVVVFLVALPLRLGVALGAGIVGIVLRGLSGSHLSVNGPAAGLTVIVATAITKVGSYEASLCAAVIARVLQSVAGRAHVRQPLMGNAHPTEVRRTSATRPSTLLRASPKSMRVLSSTKSGFSTPA
jgi:hypothetical protein